MCGTHELGLLEHAGQRRYSSPIARAAGGEHRVQWQGGGLRVLRLVAPWANSTCENLAFANGESATPRASKKMRRLSLSQVPCTADPVVKKCEEPP